MIEKVKQFLREQAKLDAVPFDDEAVVASPILHNKGLIMLQFCGWDIQLLEDGTWTWTDTTGG